MRNTLLWSHDVHISRSFLILWCLTNINSGTLKKKEPCKSLTVYDTIMCNTLHIEDTLVS